MIDARLDEFDMIEWYDVVRIIKPGTSWDEFCETWDQFLIDRAEHYRRKGLQ